MKKFAYLLLCFLSIQASAQYANGKIKIYFNRGVDNAVQGNYPAVNLNQTWADTLCAYINRAKYTIDVAQYDYSASSTVANIATAINSAYTRGVVVRWVYNGSSSNTALTSLNSGIHTVGSPTSSGYGIMHDKFVIIDANSSNTADPIVWTGSEDWSQEMVDSDYNNIIIFQDQPLAQAYTAQFNQMWGGTGASPTTANEKFGTHKSDLGPHSFTIGGSTVELYFSPKDSTNDHILDVINSANSQLFFAMYTFTETSDASAIVARKNAGVYTAGVVDSYSSTYSSWTTLTSGLGNMVKEYVEPANQPWCLYHNKYVIADACDVASDPQVLTGSHNWTSSADQLNDENTVIVHNADVANIYYQAFTHDFNNIGTSNQLTPCTVSNPCANAISATATVNTNVSCYGQSTGQATVNAHGTHGPFTYSWSSSPVQTDSVLSNVASGSYTVTVIDANSCSATASVTISQPATIGINGIVTNVACLNGNSGSIAVTASGGSGTFQYLWSTSPQQTTATASNLTAGNYTITVTDAHSCTASSSFTVTQPNTGITLSTSSTNAGCGTSSGTATVSVVTGTGNFQYAWSTSPAQTTATASNIAAGNYTVTVSNTGGCSATASVLVNSSGGPSLVANSGNTTCGANNGTANVSASGGNPPYTYLWSNGASVASISNLASGTFTVTVHDNSNCASIASVTVAASTGLVLNTSSTATTCGSNNGSATVTVSNGNNPVYNWSNGGTTSTINNIAANTYTVTVTDGGVCSATASVTVAAGTVGANFNVTADKTNVCYGDSANLCAVTGYTSYQWSNNASGFCIYVTQSASYTVTATANGGCSATSNPISINVYPANPATFTSNGATLIASAGTGFQWLLNGGQINGATNQTLVATQSGNYSVQITDHNGCTTTSSQSYITVSGIDNIGNEDFVKVYPNPLSGGNWQLEVSSDWIGSTVEIFDATGKPTFKSEVRNLKSELSLNLTQGIYLMKISGNDKSIVRKLIKL